MASNPNDEPGLPAPRPAMLNEKLTGELAAALAQRLDSIDDVMKRFGLTEEQLGRLLDNPVFQDMLREANINWAGAPSTPERIKLKSQLATEELIPTIYGIAAAPDASLGSRLDAAKLLYEMTGARKADARGPDASTPQEKFTLVLNIGNAPVTIEHETVKATEGAKWVPVEEGK